MRICTARFAKCLPVQEIVLLFTSPRFNQIHNNIARLRSKIEKKKETKKKKKNVF